MQHYANILAHTIMKTDRLLDNAEASRWTKVIEFEYYLLKSLGYKETK